MNNESRCEIENQFIQYGWKSKLRNQMSVRERQYYDLEMEKWAQEHEEKTKEGSTPEGLLTEKGKKYWKSISWALNFEWNYSDDRYQIMESSISEEEELKRILRCLADFQDRPPKHLAISEICSIENALVKSAKYICRRIGRTIPETIFKQTNSQNGQIRSPIMYFINQAIIDGHSSWQELWLIFRNKAQPGVLQEIGISSYEIKKNTKSTSKGSEQSVELHEDAGKLWSISRQDFGALFRREMKKQQTQTDSPK